jgi:hypothetical protein
LGFDAIGANTSASLQRPTDVANRKAAGTLRGSQLKGAHPMQDEAGVPNTGTVIVASGTLPMRQATVCADVLCRALNGEVLTGMAAVFDASTTRLAAHVGYLEIQYAWTFKRGDTVVGCKDGRVQTITTYCLEPSVIEFAMQCGAAAWCAKVRAARTAKRAQAMQAQVMAARLNQARAARQRNARPGQVGLFDAAP